MTAPATDTDQVRALLDSLEPACSARNPDTEQPCPAAARWVAVLTAHGNPVGRFLHCDEHRDRTEQHYRHCIGCRDVMGLAYRAEPLRGAP